MVTARGYLGARASKGGPASSLFDGSMTMTSTVYAPSTRPSVSWSSGIATLIWPVILSILNRFALVPVAVQRVGQLASVARVNVTGRDRGAHGRVYRRVLGNATGVTSRRRERRCIVGSLAADEPRCKTACRPSSWRLRHRCSSPSRAGPRSRHQLPDRKSPPYC